MVLISFAFFLTISIAIGISSSFKTKSSVQDYLLASRSTKPWLVAFSTVATNNSGYMFIGLIGFTFKYGLAAAWLMIGGILGDFIASLFCHAKLREISQKRHALSFSGAIATWHGEENKLLRKICGIFVVIFLAAYASAQFSAGSKALNAVFGLDYKIGIVIGVLIVTLYCFAGGVRASIWTNTAQSFIMISSLAILFFTALHKIGGFEQFASQLKAIGPNFVSIWPYHLDYGWFGIFFFILGWIGGGITVVGQPHIMLGFMSMEKPKDITRVRIYYYSWYIIFSSLVIATGLAARILLPDLLNSDTEYAMPVLSQAVLPEILVGFAIAGLFSAALSTADSQILSCASALTNDITGKTSFRATKIATIISTIIALGIALSGFDSVFQLALIAWSILGAVFAPLFILFALGKKTTQNQSIFIIFIGVAATLIWYEMDLNFVIYESTIGLFVGLMAYPLAKYFIKK